MATAREFFHWRRCHVMPKLHWLEDQVAAGMRRFGVGLGLLGKQGGEGIHHEMSLLSNPFCIIFNDVDRLKTTVSHHGVATLPEHLPHVMFIVPTDGYYNDPHRNCHAALKQWTPFQLHHQSHTTHIEHSRHWCRRSKHRNCAWFA